MILHFIAGLLCLSAVAVASDDESTNVDSSAATPDVIKGAAALAEAPDAITHAAKASDLDGILKEFQALQNLPATSPEMLENVTTTYRFITQWQDYLSASASANWPEAQNDLRAILENRDIHAPAFVPRSEILLRYETALHGGVPVAPKNAPSSSTGPVVTDPDVILRKVHSPSDLDDLMEQLLVVPPPPGGSPWNWTALMALSKSAADAHAGFTTSIDLKQVMAGPDWGFELSRVTAIELLAILPHYLDTDVTSPPRDQETVTAYLERIQTEAASAGNLALLQRTIAVEVALGTASGGEAPGTQHFLVGLSQEAAGQFAAAVNSYENALTDPDRFLPVKIVGDRLAVIKAAQPDEFATGYTGFVATIAAAMDKVDPRTRQMLMMLARSPQNGNPYMNMNRFPMSVPVLPIPMTLTVPQRISPNAGTPTPTPPTTK